MEWIIVIGIIIFAMNASNKRHPPNKRSNRRSITTYTPSNMPPFGSITITDILGDILDDDSENDSTEPTPPVQTTHSPNFGSEGESLHGDPYGCIGSSMAHHSHEGLEFEGHNHTLPASVYTAEKPKRDVEHPTRQSTQRTRLTTAQMRNAVIMAEILGKPVSCRRR